MSAPPRKIWVLNPPVAGASRYVIGPESGHSISFVNSYTSYYQIPPAMIERIQRCVAMKEKDAADAWHHVWYAPLSDLLSIIEGAA